VGSEFRAYGKAPTVEKTEMVGWIIDVYYRVRVSKPVIYLVIKREDGFIETVEYYGAKPYFYLRYSSFHDTEILCMAINTYEGIVGTEVTKLSNFGREDINVIKVYTDNPGRIVDFHKDMDKGNIKIDGIVDWEEADIPFAQRFLLDNQNVKPCRKATFNVVRRYRAGSYIENLEHDIKYDGEFCSIPLTTYAFDIETMNDHGDTRPERDQVLCIAVRTADGKNIKKIFSMDDYNADSDIQNERLMLSAFIDDVVREDPDMIGSFNGIRYDLPYLFGRCAHLGLIFAIGKNRSPVKIEDDGVYEPRVIIPGRICYDVYPISKRDIADLPNKSLKDVANYTGVLLHDERIEMPYYRLHRWWKAGGLRREAVKLYCIDDTEATYGIAVDVFLLNMIAISYIMGVTLPDAMSKTYGSFLSHSISKKLTKDGMLIPKRRKGTEEDEELEGGKVLVQLGGIHEDLECYDFTSTYPSIILEKGVSWENVIEEGENVPESEISYGGPNNCWRFRKPKNGKIGILPQVMLDLLQERKKYKKLYKTASDDDPKKGMYEALQSTYKRMANAGYGICAQQSHGRFYCYPMADTILLKARESILMVKDIAEKEFNRIVIYGDTDSIFIQKFDNSEEFVRVVNARTGLELNRDYGIVTYIAYAGKKKRYFFRRDNGDLVVRGYETRRGDWMDIMKVVQKKVMETLLDTKSVDKALELVDNIKTKVKNRKFKLEDVIIYKTLTKDITEYSDRHNQGHVGVAEREMMEYGYVPLVGEKIPFIIVNAEFVKVYYPLFAKEKSLNELEEGITLRSVLADRVQTLEHVDIDYVIGNQVLKPLQRIFDIFGITNITITETNIDDNKDIDVDEISRKYLKAV
jgi:DNA polymerase I